MVTTARLLAALAGFGLMGCGGDEDPAPNEALIGKWSSPLAGGPTSECIIGATFADMTYELDVVCPLSDGAFAVEAEVGDYTVDGKTLVSTPTHASCKLDRNHEPSSLAYTVTPTTLRLVTPSGGIVFEKLSDDPNSVSDSVTIRFGCIEDDGFVRSPVEAL